MNDPVVDEVRQNRQAIFAECDYSLDKLFERTKQLESHYSGKLVTKEQLAERRGRARPSTSVT